MRTTVDLPDELFKELKIRAVQQGVKLKELLTKYIEDGLQDTQGAKKQASSKRMIPTFPTGIARNPEAPLHPAITNAELYAVMEEEDAEIYHRVIAQTSKKE